MLPLLNSAYLQPVRLSELDTLAHAFLTNNVANRTSRVQGRTLVATASQVWPSSAMADLEQQVAAGWAHVAPVSGVVFRNIGLTHKAAQKVMLYGTARGILSAAVRLGVVGSYQAQRMQTEVGQCLDATLKRCAGLSAESVCQTAPVLDLLQGTHDRLYSRLFQS
jgi:urease accessory protein